MLLNFLRHKIDNLYYKKSFDEVFFIGKFILNTLNTIKFQNIVKYNITSVNFDI